MAVGSDRQCVLGTELNTVQLSIFSHRFMSIAGTLQISVEYAPQKKRRNVSVCIFCTEQMGRVLQRTSISTNIKERLDFSCAVFGPDGGLVSNAPHIPVHLGAMQETVQYQVGAMELDNFQKTQIKISVYFPVQIKTLGNKLKEGDVILSNHPCAGGSHLPDLTVITPVRLAGLLVSIVSSSSSSSSSVSASPASTSPSKGVSGRGERPCLLCSQQGAPRGHRRHHARLHAPPLHLPTSGRSRFQVL